MKTMNIPESTQREVLWEQSNNVTDLISKTKNGIINILSWKWLSESEINLARTIKQREVLDILNNQFGEWLEPTNLKIAA